MEICRFTHAERRPRLQTAIVLKSHPRKTTRRVAQGLSWNGKQPESDTEREEVSKRLRVRARETPPIQQSFIGHLVQNTIIRGQVSSTNVQSFKENLTHTEWKICQLQNVVSKSTCAWKEKPKIISLIGWKKVWLEYCQICSKCIHSNWRFISGSVEKTNNIACCKKTLFLLFFFWCGKATHRQNEGIKSK